MNYDQETRIPDTHKNPHSIRTWYRVYTSSDMSSEKKYIYRGSLSLVEYSIL